MMTPAEEGAYFRLLAYAWNSPDCCLPDDDAKLAGLSRLGPDWAAGSGKKIRECFQADLDRPGHIYNEKQRRVRAAQEERIQKAGNHCAMMREAKSKKNPSLQKHSKEPCKEAYQESLQEPSQESLKGRSQESCKALSSLVSPHSSPVSRLPSHTDKRDKKEKRGSAEPPCSLEEAIDDVAKKGISEYAVRAWMLVSEKNHWHLYSKSGHPCPLQYWKRSLYRFAKGYILPPTIDTNLKVKLLAWANTEGFDEQRVGEWLDFNESKGWIALGADGIWRPIYDHKSSLKGWIGRIEQDKKRSGPSKPATRPVAPTDSRCDEDENQPSPPTDEQKRLNKMVLRPETQEFTAVDVALHKKLTPIPQEDLLVMEGYRSARPSRDEFMPKSISLTALLTDWHKQLDYARNWRKENPKHDEEQPF